jgi:hypothetical protein
MTRAPREHSPCCTLHSASPSTPCATLIRLGGGRVGEPQREPGEDVICLARLLVGRCIELREVIDLYDAVLDSSDEQHIAF